MSRDNPQKCLCKANQFASGMNRVAPMYRICTGVTTVFETFVGPPVPSPRKEEIKQKELGTRFKGFKDRKQFRFPREISNFSIILPVLISLMALAISLLVLLCGRIR